MAQAQFKKLFVDRYKALIKTDIDKKNLLELLYLAAKGIKSENPEVNNWYNNVVLSYVDSYVFKENHKDIDDFKLPTDPIINTSESKKENINIKRDQVLLESLVEKYGQDDVLKYINKL